MKRLATITFCIAQPRTQTTTIRKQSFDNPTICVTSFEGAPEFHRKLEEMFIRCGWFKVLPSSQANQAAIKVSAKVDVMQDSTFFAASLSINGKDYNVNADANDSNLAILKGTDAILNTLFGFPAFCSRKIVFVRHSPNNIKELYACYLDGSGQERLTFNKSISTEPSWGHSNALVYTLAQNNALAIVLMDFEKRRQRVISKTRGLNSSAALSPDGRHVALTLSRDKFVDLYVIDLATKQERRLTRDNSVESSPCWSPDGKTICFVSDATGIGAPRLYIIPADGSAPAKRLQIGGGEAVSPDWDRRNNQLCFATRGSFGKYVIAILDMNSPNSKPQIVTAADGDWEAPSWAPDGRHVICTRAQKNMRDIVIVDTLRGSFRPITEGAVLSLPAWQPAR
ncbi:MAG: PD40 domain-containing protein [Victivallales bacterium]|nr:PD40 domain-containing protein [Victivallales bacterium]